MRTRPFLSTWRWCDMLISKIFWLLALVWMVLFSLNQGVELFLILSDFAFSCPIEVMVPKPVDRSI